MAFLPFYISRHKQLKIVIIGGGYAGIAASVTLLRYMPDVDITIVDPQSHHLKITHLHETFRYPLQDYLIPFSTLERRFGCRHICAALIPDEDTLRQWQYDKFLAIDDEILEFDYILITSGSAVAQMDKAENIFDLHDFMAAAGSSLLESRLDMSKNGGQFISVVGGGATGIQFLFEIAYFLRRQKAEIGLRLIHGADRVLNQFPAGFSTYAQTRMSDLNIDFYPDTYYHGQETDSILLEENETGRKFDLPSTLSLLFLGKKADTIFFTNAFGQVMVEHNPLQNIFAAGDCSVYQSFGSDTLTAQSAVRKGKLAARNILRHSGSFKLLEPYLHRDLGYVVSLGPADAVGWLALEDNVVGGMPALMIKELVEAQYDLLLTGIDTYLI
ncbi:pyridine nucleotide-disulfide oxidoreductase [Nitrosospira lacus]|uniref:Pyridine nucleotide-disulfide oxidoreductase n=1 Tax=Nitrosospira lacus TaxID=1288494 RepID=A0A1W6SNJ9_9PROT|nr:FAD-dependent oxidoreductase [Nitrosospira lacus]ARO87399.1 pyridine nucleotide-disulfide oxidoreductase [Nitrosospira lacus]